MTFRLRLSTSGISVGIHKGDPYGKYYAIQREKLNGPRMASIKSDEVVLIHLILNRTSFIFDFKLNSKLNA